MVRRAIGDAAGPAIKAQIRRATVQLGYGADAWRAREALHGRAGSWSAGAPDDLLRRFAAWQEQNRSSTCSAGAGGPTTAQRLDAIRAGLTELTRQVDEVAADITGGAP